MERKMTRAKMKRKRKIQYAIIAFATAVIVVAAGVGTTRLTYHLDGQRSVATQGFYEKKPEINELSLVMVGDNLLHMPLIRNAESEDGSFCFDSLYETMLPYFQEADLSVIVQETVLGGASLGYSGYPLFNSPQEVADSLANAGFDVVLHATNHVMDKGEKGVLNSINAWEKHPEVAVLGINETEDEYKAINYIEKNGIKLALLNYTDSTNGIPVPSQKPYLVNTVDEEKIINDLTIAEENADFTIVFMHWGTEYSFTPDKGQTKLAKLMCENGADLIMGSHPHVIEPVEWIKAENGNKALVFYSLGNYVSRQKEAANLLGAMGEVKICSTEEKGTYIDSASVMPIVTHYNTNSRGFKVYPLKDYTDELAQKHGVAQYDGKVSKERFQKIFDKVFSQNTAVTIMN